MRGKVAERLFAERLVGITPAYAGKRAASAREAYFIWDHPRVCGEKSNECVKPEIPQGSPPRMRGKVANTWLGRTNMGITPACAGKSSTATRAARSTGDHPRVCGEKSKYRLQINWWLGSPPRVRGKAERPTGLLCAAGITPACAGKSFQPFLYLFDVWDHPRVCGEKVLYPLVMMIGLGSPPRVRGKD